MSDVLQRVRSYADKYMLGIFLEICRKDYGGGFDVNSKRKLVHKICKCILGITQEYTNSRGHKRADTPDELYAKFIIIVAGLPDDASLWSVTFCSAYLSVLTVNLRDKMEESKFIMPPLNSMAIKALQITGLRTVRTAAVLLFR